MPAIPQFEVGCGCFAYLNEISLEDPHGDHSASEQNEQMMSIPDSRASVKASKVKYSRNEVYVD